MKLAVETTFSFYFLKAENSVFSAYMTYLGRSLLRYIKFAGFNVRIPAHPVLRIGLGVILVFGGFLGFLPILGFWMLPLGLVVLSIDFAFVRRLRRRSTVSFGRWLLKRYPTFAKKIGFGA